jgi:hypothetical protein
LGRALGNASGKAIDLLRKHPEKINWDSLSDNTSNKTVSMLREYPDKINWNILSFNPANGVIEFLLENLDKFYIYNLLDNNRRVLYSNRRSLITDMIKAESRTRWDHAWDGFLSAVDSDDAIQLLMDNIGRVDFDWFEISKNANRTAAELLRRNPDKIHSINLSLNHSNEMLVLLKDHPEKISWRHLSINSAPVAVEILAERPDMIDWINLSSNKNPRAMDIFLRFPEYVDYSVVFKNPAVFVLDYAALKRRIAHFKEELVAAASHPARIGRILDSGVDIDDIDDYFRV